MSDIEEAILEDEFENDIDNDTLLSDIETPDISDEELNDLLLNAAPPPLPLDLINAIPTVEITQEQVNDKLQCSVCKQEFTMGEIVKKLQCEHLYHELCICPWLKIHATCPICRLQLYPPINEVGNTVLQEIRDRRYRRRNQSRRTDSRFELMESDIMADNSSGSSQSSGRSTDRQMNVEALHEESSHDHLPLIDVATAINMNFFNLLNANLDTSYTIPHDLSASSTSLSEIE